VSRFYYYLYVAFLRHNRKKAQEEVERRTPDLKNRMGKIDFSFEKRKMEQSY
jgi:hypothetical protein